MLSFRVIKSGNAVEIDCDAEGMSVLLGALAELVGEHASHRHLWAPSHGGSALSDTTPHGEKALNEVIINYVESGSN